MTWKVAQTSLHTLGCAVALVACGGSSQGSGDDAGPVDPRDSGARDDSGEVRDSGATEPEDAQVAEGLAPSANSVTRSAGGTRSDPEGVAADSETQKLGWRDAAGRDRSMTLGGYLHQYDLPFLRGRAWVAGSANDDAYGHPGFGYVVSHNTETGNSPLGKANTPTRVNTRVFSGGHHALHRVELVYDRDKEGGGRGLAIPVVIDWFVATGRDHPIWSVTFKLDQLQNPQGVDLDQYRMDTRAPYGSLNFDGAPDRASGDAIGGVSWGDSGFLFSTNAQELTLNAPWTYNQTNSVNFVRAWTATTNAELGIVQTRAGDNQLGYGERVVGRERGNTSATAYLNKGDCTGVGDPRVYSMPCVSGWPYQMMNYDWDPAAAAQPGDSTGTKLMAWGSPYGYLGASSFDLFDYAGKADGRGERSYATFVVLGPKCTFGAGDACDQPGSVQQTVAQVEALTAATLVVQEGTLAVTLPRGPAASSTKPVSQGYNDSYAAYYLEAADNAARFTFTPAAGKPVDRPLFVLQGYTGTIPDIRVDDAELSVNSGDAQSDAFVSLDVDTQELWITLNRSVGEAITLRVDGAGD